jgi:hypothetical protein
MIMHSKRRTEGLLVDELPDETIVYDTIRYEAHCLNRAATLVWKHCDGRTPLAELAGLLRQELHLAADQALVRLILEQLEESHLLEKKAARVVRTPRPTRRRVARQLAILGLSGLVMTIPVPTALAAGSVPNGGMCTASSQCQSGCCCQDNSGGNRNKCVIAGVGCNNCLSG